MYNVGFNFIPVYLSIQKKTIATELIVISNKKNLLRDLFFIEFIKLKEM